MRGFKTIPVVRDLEANQASYLRKNLDDLDSAIKIAFKDSDGVIKILPLIFFQVFIKKQASLYSGRFKRDGLKNVDNIDIASFDNEMKYFERYYHLNKKSGLYLYIEDNKVKFKSLSSLNYFKEKDYCFIQSESDLVLLFIKNEDLVTVYEIRSKKEKETLGEFNTDISMYNLVSAYDLDKEFKDQKFGKEFSYIELSDKLSEIPLLELAYRDINIAIANYIAVLETEWIVDATWGRFNAQVKMVSHPVAFTDMAKEEAQQATLDFGRRNKFTVFPIGGEFKLFDMGNITVLRQVIEAFNGFIEQQCLVNGVDYHALIPQSKTGGDVESGESKKQTLAYINEYRRDFFSDFQIFESDVFLLIEKIWGISNPDVRIVFEDREISETREGRRTYATAMRDDGFFTPVESYAYARDVSIEDAEHELDKVDNEV